MTIKTDESLMFMTNSLPVAGGILRTAWGMMTCHCLPVRHAYCMRRLKLPLVYRHYAAAHNLGHIRAGIDGYDYKAGKQSVDLKTCQHRDAVIDYHCLHYHRRAAENLHIHTNECVNYLQQPPKRVFLSGMGIERTTPTSRPMQNLQSYRLSRAALCNLHRAADTASIRQ